MAEIHEAIEACNIDRVRVLLREGRNVHLPDNNGNTPLMVAIFFGSIHTGEKCAPYIELVRLLLNRGANPRFRNKKGWTPIHAASSNANAEMVLLLIDYGADINARDAKGRTPLMVAIEAAGMSAAEKERHAEFIRFLQRFGNPN